MLEQGFSVTFWTFAAWPVENGIFRNLGVPYFGVLTMRILLFRVLY